MFIRRKSLTSHVPISTEYSDCGIVDMCIVRSSKEQGHQLFNKTKYLIVS
ncbi:MAG: hypothetical protein AEth_01618 [Candidatus Argoarchaeum ethanivorans]|uniref:Uncharacterized protein n=1 Tax=Candidatus Argoarchaeum ethanivorans TaxID=2608793 RepID=A0A8B3RZY6_9EURY|nr:MAG: hypothetical protein AEth_01618 [Candidatus Argoarchaeum ethanivorans]